MEVQNTYPKVHTLHTNIHNTQIHTYTYIRYIQGMEENYWKGAINDFLKGRRAKKGKLFEKGVLIPSEFVEYNLRSKC